MAFKKFGSFFGFSKKEETIEENIEEIKEQAETLEENGELQKPEVTESASQDMSSLESSEEESPKKTEDTVQEESLREEKACEESVSVPEPEQPVQKKGF